MEPEDPESEISDLEEELKLEFEPADDLGKQYLPLTEEPHSRKAGDYLFAISKHTVP